MNRLTRIAIAVAVTAPLSLSAQTLFIDDATVHTMLDSAPMENADILIVDGVITAVDYGLEIPADAELIEAEGRPVTPGFFAGISALGIVEVSLEAATVDNQLILAETPIADKLRPEFNVALAFNPASSLIPITRVEGYNWTVLHAQREGNIIGGQGRPAMLGGHYDSLIGDPVLFIDVGSDASEESFGSRAAQWMLLSQAVDESESTIEWTPDPLLTPAGRKAMKLFTGSSASSVTVFHVHRASDILQVLAFSEEHGFNPIIFGGSEAWKVADQLAQADVPVLIDPLANLPADFDQLGARLDAASILHQAGVRIGILNTGNGTHNARDIRFRAGIAVAHGLPWQAALEGVTIRPAQMFGVDHHTGTIEANQRANIVIWSGDPLDVTSVADLVILDGEPDSMVTRQTLLRDRYSAPEGELPRGYIKP
ncbi:MAG TPA: amidohydrolase family protein [Xanthomonadales bacterium]|nr:amidohydrolase family protein [Xanthomonadales bacterium]